MKCSRWKSREGEGRVGSGELRHGPSVVAGPIKDTISSAIRSAASGRARANAAARMRSLGQRVEEAVHLGGQAGTGQLGVRHVHGRARGGQVPRVLRLMVGRGAGEGHQHRRHPPGQQLGYRAACPSHRHVRGGKRQRKVVQIGEGLVARVGAARQGVPHAFEVALAGHVEHREGGGTRGEGGQSGVVDGARPQAASEHQHDRVRRVEPEAGEALLPRRGQQGRPQRPAGVDELGAPLLVGRERQADPVDQQAEDAVGPPQVRVHLHHQTGDPADRRLGHHGAGGVRSHPHDRRRTDSAEQTPGVRGGQRQRGQRPQGGHPDPTFEAADTDGREGVSGARDQGPLHSPRAAAEMDLVPSPGEDVSEREGRDHVSRGPSPGDQDT